MNFILLLLLLGILVFLFKKKKFNRHSFNQKKAIQVLGKINSFEHPGQKINYLKKIDPFVFEELLLTAFEKKGFRIIRNKKYTGDGGIDGTIYTKENYKIILQAKRYSGYINRQHIKDFENKIHNNNALKGYFIHTGKSSSNTRSMFKSSSVELISGNKLIELITKIK